MNQEAKENDKIDKLLLDYFANNTSVPESTKDAIEDTLAKIIFDNTIDESNVKTTTAIITTDIKKKTHTNKIYRKYLSFGFKNAAVFLILTGFLTTTLVVARNMDFKLPKNLNRLDVIGINNDTLFNVVQTTDWVQNVDLPAIKIDENYSVKLVSIIIDPMNLYVSFDLQSKEVFNDAYRLNILDLVIDDCNGNILYDYGSEGGFIVSEGWTNIVSSRTDIKELFFMMSPCLDKLEKLNISFSKISIYKRNTEQTVIKELSKECKFAITLEEKFKNQNVIEYTQALTKNASLDTNIKKAMQTNTGFYIIIETSKRLGNIDFDLFVNDKRSNCDTKILLNQNLEDFCTVLLIYNTSTNDTKIINPFKPQKLYSNPQTDDIRLINSLNKTEEINLKVKTVLE